MHARGSGEAARRAKRARAISHARGHLRVSRFCLDGLQKKERLLVVYLAVAILPSLLFTPMMQG